MAYNPYLYPMYQQNYNYQPPQQQTIQNGGFISVRSIDEAYNWAVAPGNSITFKDENAPYVYTKTRGFSQLDPPVFEKYRLVKEEDTPPAAQKRPEKATNYDEQISLLWDEIKGLKRQINAFYVDEEEKDEHTGDVSTVHE